MPVASCTETNKDPKTAERPSERDRTDQSAGFPVVAADCIGRALLRYLASFVSSRFDYGRSRTRPNQLAAHPRVLRPDPMCSTSKPFSYFSLSLSSSPSLSFLSPLLPALLPLHTSLFAIARHYIHIYSDSRTRKLRSISSNFAIIHQSSFSK